MNYADYWTKHHPESHHRNIRKEFLTPTIVIEMLRIEQHLQQKYDQGNFAIIILFHLPSHSELLEGLELYDEPRFSTKFSVHKLGRLQMVASPRN